MEVNSVSESSRFGIKLAPDFAEKTAQSCLNIPFFEAEKMAAKLKEIKPDCFYLKSVSTDIKRNGFLGPKYRTIKIQYETQKPDNSVSKHLYGDAQENNNPFSAAEIFEVIKHVINKYTNA